MLSIVVYMDGLQKIEVQKSFQKCIETTQNVIECRKVR